MDQESKDSIFRIIQSFLSDPPVIIWGSGATIDFGLPSMEQLMAGIKVVIPNIDQEGNLENELSKITDREKLKEISQIVRSKVLKQDIACLKNAVQDQAYLNPVKNMIKKFYNTHPRKVNIITTNYDRVLEYAIAQLNINYCDGFSGSILSRFNHDLFTDEKIINLIKVHGSLNWSELNGSAFFLPAEYNVDDINDTIVLPTQDKHKRTHQDPYRSLLTKSDEYIESAKSFLVIGFGFNDEHITPQIDSKVKDGVPIIIITKSPTSSCKERLSKSNYFCILEREGENTKIEYKTPDRNGEIAILGEFWRLNKFMEIL